LRTGSLLFIWAGVKVGKYIIEGQIDGHNIPKLLKNNKAFNLKKINLLMCLGFISFPPDFQGGPFTHLDLNCLIIVHLLNMLLLLFLKFSHTIFKICLSLVTI